MMQSHRSSAITIDRRFCGPPESGNGGYTCGITAGYIEGDAEVTLLRPPPLDTALEVIIHDTDHVSLNGASGTVSEGKKSALNLSVPFTPTFAEAEKAAAAYKGYRHHPYPACFVCGPERNPGDGMHIFAGPLPGKKGVAAPWIPDRSLCDASGSVKPEFVWAALDCPGYFAINADVLRTMLLGRLSASIQSLPTGGDRCIVAGWPLSAEGRKHRAATALFSEKGDLFGQAVAVWIEVSHPA